MLSLLRSDMYRLLHGKMIWVTLVIVLGMSALIAGVMGWTRSADFAVMAYEEATPEERERMDAGESAAVVTSSDAALSEGEQALYENAEAPRTTVWANFMASGFLPTAAACLAVLMCASDFEHGFAKSLLTQGRAARAYWAERLVLAVILTAAVMLMTVASSEVAFRAFGFSFLPEDALQAFGWLGLMLLEGSFYAVLALLAVWVFRSKVAGIVVALTVGSGFVGQMLAMGLASLSLAVPESALPVLEAAVTWLPQYSMMLLGNGTAIFAMPDVGALSAPLHALVSLGGGTVLVACLCLALAPRRDVA